MIHIENKEQFDKVISSGVTLVDFYASWCGPCRMLSPIIEQIDEEYENKVTVAKVDVEECGDIAAKYGISAIPALLVFKDNNLARMNVGFIPRDDIANLLDQILAE